MGSEFRLISGVGQKRSRFLNSCGWVRFHADEVNQVRVWGFRVP